MNRLSNAMIALQAQCSGKEEIIGLNVALRRSYRGTVGKAALPRWSNPARIVRTAARRLRLQSGCFPSGCAGQAQWIVPCPACQVGITKVEAAPGAEEHERPRFCRNRIGVRGGESERGSMRRPPRFSARGARRSSRRRRSEAEAAQT